MKKYAFLILAHTDPIHLQKLVYSLDFEHFDIYIHIDKKQDITKFQFDQYTLKYSELFIIQDREFVYWGDISIVHATVTLPPLKSSADFEVGASCSIALMG